MSTELKTRGQTMAADVSALLRARNPLLWVVTREEARVERLLIEASVSAGYIPRTWDIAQGKSADITGKVTNADATDPGAALSLIGERAKGNERAAFGSCAIFAPSCWTPAPLASPPRGSCATLSRAPRRARPREIMAQAIIILSPKSEVPAELAGHATVIDWPMPDRAEIAAILDAAIESLPDELEGHGGTERPARCRDRCGGRPDRRRGASLLRPVAGAAAPD